MKRLRALGVALLMVCATIPVSVGTSAAAPVALVGSAHETKPLEPRFRFGHGMSCPTDLHCVLAANPAATTDDGGASWTARSTTLGESSLSAVDCPSVSVCVGVDGFSEMLRSSDGGVSWTVAAPIVQSIADVECPTVLHCLAVGASGPIPQTGQRAAQIWTTDDGGATWSKRFDQPSNDFLSGVRCGSASFCIATGSASLLEQTADGGVTWSPFLVGSFPVSGGLACVGATTCLVFVSPRVGTAQLEFTTNSGATWIPLIGDVLGFVPSAVDCMPTTASCVAVGGLLGSPASATFDLTTFAGHVSTVPPRLRSIDFVQCNGSACRALGSPSPYDVLTQTEFVARVVLSSTDGGATWSRVAPIAPAPVLNDLSCGDASHCMAIGTKDVLDPVATLVPAVMTTADAGSTWVERTPPPTLERVKGGCSSVSLCTMVGPLTADPTQGAIAVSNDFGGSWQAATINAPSALDQFSSPSCSGTVCFATAREVLVGTSQPWPFVVLRTTDGAANWSVVQVVADTDGLGIGCADAAHCLVTIRPSVANNTFRVERTIDGGATWQQGVAPTADAVRTDDPNCMALGCFVSFTSASGAVSLRFSPDLGATWPTSGSVGATVLGPQAPQCFASDCIANSFAGPQLSTAGSAWTLIPGLIGQVFDKVVCVDTALCITLTAHGSRLGSALGRVTLASAPIPSVSAVVPARLLETRVGAGLTTADHRFEGIGARPAGSTLVLPVAGRGGVAADATSAMLNITVTEPAAVGFVTVYPCGTALPVASSLNYLRGLTVANSVMAKLGTGGTVCIYTRAATHLVVDADAFVPNGSSSVLGVTPARLLETRRGPGLVTVDHVFQGVGKMAAGSTLALQVAGRGGVPFGAASAVLNVTVTEPTGPGFITVYPCDQAQPRASNVNYVVGQTVPNGVYAKLDPLGRVCLFTSSSTQLVVDVNAYAPGAGSFLDGVVPARLLETRTGPGLGTVDGLFNGVGTLPTRTAYALKVGGRGGVPADASAVVLNVTVTEPTAPGFVTVYPCDQPVPLASNVNYVAGATVANAVVAKLAPDGTVCVFSSAATHSVIDVNAYIP